jgi:hypothetical protein
MGSIILLNCKAYWFLIKALCPFVRGGYYELRSQYIETLPVPRATAAQKAEVSFQSVVQVRNKLTSAYQEIFNMQV